MRSEAISSVQLHERKIACRLAPRNDDYPHAYGALAVFAAIGDKTETDGRSERL